MRDTTKRTMSSAAAAAVRGRKGTMEHRDTGWRAAGPSLTLALIAPLALAVAVTLAGCGGDGAPVTQSGQHVRGPVIERSTPAPVTEGAQLASVQAEDAPVVSMTPDAAPAASEGLPPDVLVSLADTLVVPGAAVEITAQATSDVTELVLWDGIGDREAFTYDATAGVWHARYRVPLKAPWERIGLSVTARNDDDRWRRVWVFLRVHEPVPAATQEMADGTQDVVDGS